MVATFKLDHLTDDDLVALHDRLHAAHTVSPKREDVILAHDVVKAVMASRDISTPVQMAADAKTDASKPYGDVRYADPGYQEDGKKRYPIDTPEHCRAAWSYINQAKNASAYTSEQLAAIKKRIQAAGGDKGIEFAKEAILENVDTERPGLIRRMANTFARVLGSEFGEEEVAKALDDEDEDDDDSEPAPYDQDVDPDPEYLPDLTDDDVDSDDIHPFVNTPVTKALVAQRYTLGPVYIPNLIDAHGEYASPDDLQKALWEWQKGDSTVFLQHTDIPAGERVELVTWPDAVDLNLTTPTGVRKVHFPANTPFMGVVWHPWAWDMVTEGKLQGYSIGGQARRIEVDLDAADDDT